ncbi:39S ribosomal protein L41, mitochondrial [Plasmodiophora brassicae]|uniref:39S ribosomal protein L41, mitochondrial n=1 Tax=Plasmodiophora brassicae TaxID=37360 RepID=A0A0G4IN11_PLABS|nr:hypothetical protein PBRA_005204 [Plasmodiophora brassicae]SPQ94652.1 unnamed protein product [Plasmodiophora brassicae]
MLGVIRGLLRSKKTKNLRGNMIPKRGNNQFYKGKGCLKTGWITRKGVYRSFSNLDKMLDYQVPDLTGFNLKPYVSHQTPLAPKLDESGAPPAS